MANIFKIRRNAAADPAAVPAATADDVGQLAAMVNFDADTNNLRGLYLGVDNKGGNPSWERILLEADMAAASAAVVPDPTTATMNTIEPTGDFPPLTIKEGAHTGGFTFQAISSTSGSLGGWFQVTGEDAIGAYVSVDPGTAGAPTAIVAEGPTNAHVVDMNQDPSGTVVGYAFSGTSGMIIPAGTDAQKALFAASLGPGARDRNYVLRYNTTSDSMEIYVDPAWKTIGGGAAGLVNDPTSDTANVIAPAADFKPLEIDGTNVDKVAFKVASKDATVGASFANLAGSASLDIRAEADPLSDGTPRIVLAGNDAAHAAVLDNFIVDAGAF